MAQRAELGAQVACVPLLTRSGNRTRATGPPATLPASNTRHSDRSLFRSDVIVTR